MILPDPTADLHWLDFKGPIQDIFHQNATKHPQRPCVVETASESTSRREFTYGQIDQASNLLAYHLRQSGVVIGDVVMIYAYRGVDLVIAIMGVLRCAATFSVIDPQYPPDRQRIYLEVAQPRALVILAKATSEAGELSSLVRTYIQNELRLKTEIPALRIDDAGLLLGGGESEDEDLFDNLRQTALNDNVNEPVDPDTNPTLSFTSGSEGRPKGVLGRHFSLTHYFPFMAERFGLGSNDRFTMLSGIAHDPIQRDIFTPLFLGAQLLVPSREDIQHERLAEWMHKHNTNVTHLTPAMGQVLVGGATTQFPSLHHAFFVGDVLTKRDCNLLRNLAVNVSIINMYGTTETQRAVSYYEIPSRATEPHYLDNMKDIIPAGRGMRNVQLLVVNQNDRTKICNVGEVGEIYVRAGGLAEGYLGDDLLNEKKFIKNWFTASKSWPQPARDRLYRTGDLGHYLPSGDVECTGRADDQVKIRGFRIELGEINGHLSQHQLVRDSVTLVRRNKDEEPTLVSYVVPELNSWPRWLSEKSLRDTLNDGSMAGMLKRFRPLQSELRDYLKTKLPNYAVPTHFIPLERLPLNPNGKVDKPALPFPDIADITAAKSEDFESRTKTEQLLAEIWGTLLPSCDSASLNLGESFFDIGGHSILAQRLLLNIKQRFNVQLSMVTLFRDSTLKSLASAIDRARDPNAILAGADGKYRQANGQINGDTQRDQDYADDARRLVSGLAARFPSIKQLNFKRPLEIFMTGATGFLGAFLLRELLSRNLNVTTLVRAKSKQAGLERLEKACRAYGVWSHEWSSRLSCVVGSLGSPKLGLDDAAYVELTNVIDVVIHNGAQVHWVYPYSKLKPTNVQGTIEALQLCAAGRPKHFAFVSSTSVLDKDHYVKVSEDSILAGGPGVSETDDLQGSSSGLGTGYGQSKWVGEYLVREAGKRGLEGTIVRPGYILGDSVSGVTNTDDFLIRMLKASMQLSQRPHITNTVNMCPVDYVARVIVASALTPPQSPLGIAQITDPSRLRFDEYLAALPAYGYPISEVSYANWQESIENYVEASSTQTKKESFALMPLYHFVTDDLPANTKAPELDDANAREALRLDAARTGRTDEDHPPREIREELIGKYLRFLVDVGFIPPPPKEKGSKGKDLPSSTMKEGQREALERLTGRGALV